MLCYCTAKQSIGVPGSCTLLCFSGERLSYLCLKDKETRDGREKMKYEEEKKRGKKQEVITRGMMTEKDKCNE